MQTITKQDPDSDRSLWQTIWQAIKAQLSELDIDVHAGRTTEGGRLNLTVTKPTPHNDDGHSSPRRAASATQVEAVEALPQPRSDRAALLQGRPTDD